MQEEILDSLRRKQDYISGDHLSRRLGITRQALWKHIQGIKDLGYDIVAVPHLGYRLISCPDKLLPLEVGYHLNTKFIGKKMHYFAAVSSTMDVATKLGLDGAAEGTLVLSETQTRGRGRLGRTWFSPKNKGIYLSLILRPRIPPNVSPILTLLIAVSVCDAVKKISGLDSSIKWPNDILMHNKKLGGILTELNAEMDEVRFVVIGLGLNVNNDKKTLLSGATSLKEHKKEAVNRIELLREILRRIEANYTLFQERGSGPVIERWRQHNVTLGKRVRIVSHREHREGQALDIDSDGGLLLRNDAGLTEKVMAGDVIHCRQ